MKFSLSPLILFLPFSLNAQKLHLISRSENIVFNFKLENKAAFYNITFKGRQIVNYSLLSLN
jgi:hypothetical protein